MTKPLGIGHTLPQPPPNEDQKKFTSPLSRISLSNQETALYNGLCKSQYTPPPPPPPPPPLLPSVLSPLPITPPRSPPPYSSLPRHRRPPLFLPPRPSHHHPRPSVTMPRALHSRPPAWLSCLGGLRSRRGGDVRRLRRCGDWWLGL